MLNYLCGDEALCEGKLKSHSISTANKGVQCTCKQKTQVTATAVHVQPRKFPFQLHLACFYIKQKDNYFDNRLKIK